MRTRCGTPTHSAYVLLVVGFVTGAVSGRWSAWVAGVVLYVLIMTASVVALSRHERTGFWRTLSSVVMSGGSIVGHIRRFR